jgi:preprotein translocase subunit SecD
MSISEQGIDNMRQGIMDQTMTTLRNRVNELGISEATVQQSGLSHISVEMPGVLDSARAQQILGGTATVEMRMVDVEHDPHAPTLGSTLYDDNGKPVLLKNQVILSGSSITDAQASADESGLPAVNISLGGGSEALFHRTTALNIGKPMSIVYVENKIKEHNDGKGHITKTNVKSERIISVATIRSALPNNFQITGLGSAEEAQNLSLLLRAGALPATINIIEERTLGPKLGLDNINKGIFSVKIGMAIVIVFMALYYGVFGLISDLALLCNMLLLIALLSALGMTLTLAGIAGIVLTVGLAVDSNVLIFERIREELRNGAQIQTAIFSGFDRAFVTIVDANITTLIVALVLFGIGTGPVKGFAVTLSVGILTSMISAMGITRALVNLTYGRRKVKKISIGL